MTTRIRERVRTGPTMGTRPVPATWPNGSAVYVQNMSTGKAWGERDEGRKGFLGRIVYDHATRILTVWRFEKGFYRYAGETRDGTEARALLRD